MKKEHKQMILNIIWIIGIFLVAGSSTFKYGYTVGINDMKIEADKFIYENCTCLGFTSREELKIKENNKYILPDNSFNFTIS